MAQKDYIGQALKVKQKAVFNIDELYKTMHRWFELYGYDLQELEYKEEMEARGKKVIVRWYAEKEIDDYIKFVIELSFMVNGLEDVMIEQEGVKVKTNKGEIEIRLTAYLLKDYDDYWKGPLKRFLRDVYDKFVIKSRIESLEGELYEELYKLMDEIKAFLNLHRF